MKKVLITGANSYIGDSVKKYLESFTGDYDVKVKETVGWKPEVTDFKGFQVVFNVAGIAHRKETEENRQLYFDVNHDLSVKIAQTAKAAGVKQLILLSSMSVYGKTIGYITKNSPINPKNAYGKSKAEADVAIEELVDDDFKFVCLRPPMVYGKGCKGNYQLLRKFALKSPVFPNYQNKRSMVYIGNLCEFVKNCIDEEREGLFFPQNSQYVGTADMVRSIADNHGKSIRLISIFNYIIRIVPLDVVRKVFGDLTYEPVDLVDKYSFNISIKLTED